MVSLDEEEKDKLCSSSYYKSDHSIGVTIRVSDIPLQAVANKSRGPWPPLPLLMNTVVLTL